MSYLVRLVQKPSPPTKLPLERRNELFRKVLRSDLSYGPPTRPRPIEGNVEREMEREIFKMYELGQVTASEYQHIKDRHYEELHGMQFRRRVGKMTEKDKAIIEAFVEESEGDREERLRKEIEGEVGVNPDYDEDGIVDRNGETIKLHHMDRRAVEFRERLRTWSVTFVSCLLSLMSRFNHAPWESIKRENFIIWLAWACFNAPYEEIKADDEKYGFLLESMDLVEARTGTTFPDGYDPNINIMRLTLDPVIAKGRPLILYALTHLINTWLARVVYPYYGMGVVSLPLDPKLVARTTKLMVVQ
jgi:hypothetical protein